MISDIRVLELSAPSTMLAGAILGDLGADVVTVEPLQGAAGRRMAPFLGGVPGVERSLTWQALNRNKRGMTLAVESVDGRAILRELLGKFDIVIASSESPVAGVLGEIERGDREIRCIIVPFSESGPKNGYLGADIVIQAASGSTFVTGDQDRKPIIFPVPQSQMHAGAEAAIACLAALAARDADGLGQAAMVSARTASMFAAFSQPLIVGARGESTAGAVAVARRPQLPIPTIWACSDGYVVISIMPGPAFPKSTTGLAHWVRDLGLLDDETAGRDWARLPDDGSKEGPSSTDFMALVAAVEVACVTVSKADLQRIARERGFFLAPIRDMADIAGAENFRERGIFLPVAVEAGGPSREVPLRFATFSNFAIECRRAAPSLSEHTGSC